MFESKTLRISVDGVDKAGVIFFRTCKSGELSNESHSLRSRIHFKRLRKIMSNEKADNKEISLSMEKIINNFAYCHTI